MIIKDTRRKLFPLVLGLGGIVFSAFLFYAGFRLIASSQKPVPGTHFKEFSTSEIPLTEILIEPEIFSRISALRISALKNGVISNAEKIIFPAQFISGGDTLEAQLRLKGDWTDHLAGEKWSFRISLLNNVYWKGMREFSLQSPQTRNLLHEWLFHKFLRHEGLLATRYFFSGLLLNGKSLGLYAVEEHFSKELPESQMRREGLILKFSEDALWAIREEKAEKIFSGTNSKGDSIWADPWYAADILAFNEKRIQADENLFHQYQIAASLMRQLRDSVLPPSRIMDPAKTGAFLAATDMFFAYHGLQWHNLRFYYDPISSRLELIGFDANIYASKGLPDPIPLFAAGFDPGSKGMVHAFAHDPEIRAQYLSAAKRFSSPGYLESFIEKEKPEWERLEKILGIEFEGYEYPQEDLLKVRDRVAKRLLLEPEFGGKSER